MQNIKGLAPPAEDVPSKRYIGASLFVGILHAFGLVLVALNVGYTIGPSDYSLFGIFWRYGGLVVVAALPVGLALRYRLILPLVALVLTTGYVLGMELTPPGPTFRDVADLEHLDEPTGIMVVENGLYIVRYMVDASVWTLGFCFVGLIEYAARTLWERLPPVRNPVSWLSIPASRRQAIIVATGGGLLHAVVMVWFAHRLGVPISGAVDWVMYAFGAVGMWVLATVPLYLLVRRGLFAPVTLLTVFVLLDVRAQFTASVDDPHSLYYWGWFFFLGILLVVAAIEYGLHRIDVVYERFSSS